MSAIVKEYDDGLREPKIASLPEGGRVLTAKRTDENGNVTNYYYTDRAETCDQYQRKRGIKPPSPTEGLSPKEQSYLKALSAYYKKDFHASATLFANLAQHQYPAAEYMLGIQYEQGEGRSADAIKARNWYERAAQSNYASAQWKLGMVHQQGKGGAHPNPALASKWYRKAADQGHAWAQNALGGLYERGEGVSKSLVQAVRLYTLAGEQGNAEAEKNLLRIVRGL